MQKHSAVLLIPLAIACSDYEIKGDGDTAVTEDADTDTDIDVDADADADADADTDSGVDSGAGDNDTGQDTGETTDTASATDTGTHVPADTGSDSGEPEPPDTGITPTDDTGVSVSDDTGDLPAPPDDAPCSTDLTLDFPDGTTTTLDFCASYALDLRLDFDPVATPEMRDIVVLLQAVEEVEPGDGCWIRLSIPALCGEGYYRMHGDSGDNVALDLGGCPDIPDEHRGLFVSREGYTHINTATVDLGPDSSEGDLTEATVAGHIAISAPTPPAEYGPGLRGDFRVTRLLPAHSVGETDCLVLTGDDDEDGAVSTEFGGGDCDDFDIDTHPGAAELESETLCMRDGDGDGYGSDAPRSTDITAGMDCDDDDATIHPDAEDLASDGVDFDCDGSD